MRLNENAYDATATTFTGRGTLALITGFNPGLNRLYFQIFDDTAPGSNLYQTILVGPGANFSYRPSEQANPFITGLTWGVSSTPDSYSAAADEVFVHVEANTGEA